MKLVTHSNRKGSDGVFDEKSGTSSSSSKNKLGSEKLENLDEDDKRNHRLNQNRISAMKCRQKKKQQFHELIEKKEILEKSNLELQEKLDNIKKQFKETEEENDDLKKRLNFMERQQEILFRIVSEAKGSYQHNSYPMTSLSSMQVGQMDPLLKLTVEQKLGNPNPSAFALSKPSLLNIQRSGHQATPISNHAQNVSNGTEMSGQTDSAVSLSQLLSEIYSSNIGKH